MKIVVGLGNPGGKYIGSRHNVGFETLDELARRLSATSGRKARFHANVQESRLDDEPLQLVWPQTYMNLSGRCVGEFVEFFKLEHERLLIVCDDFHLPVGSIRFRARGSAAGQKGLSSILQQLGTDEISRLRIGVGPLPDGWDAAAFVLGRFAKSERPAVESAVTRAVDGITCWVRNDVDVAMNLFNQASP
jgi:PTH1 family peptidyl-tRNA hydrolase